MKLILSMFFKFCLSGVFCDGVRLWRGSDDAYSSRYFRRISIHVIYFRLKLKKFFHLQIQNLNKKTLVFMLVVLSSGLNFCTTMKSSIEI